MSEQHPLARFIGDKDFESAKAYIEKQRGRIGTDEGERLVFNVLHLDDSHQDVIDLALEVFMQTRKNYSSAHESWVHALSHFTKNLWENGQLEWIKRFYKIAFQGANELGMSNCSDRLVFNFQQYALWHYDPADFHLTMENLTWMNWKYCAETKAWIEHGKFESEKDFLIFWHRSRLDRKAFVGFDYELQTHMVNVKGLRATIEKLRGLGEDVTSYAGLEKELLTTQLSEEEKNLANEHEWVREKAEKAIAIIQKQLTEC